MDLEHLDVKTEFFHRYLDEIFYMQQPKGFVVEGTYDWVCRLNKSLFDLKQSPRQWYKKFVSFMLGIGFSRNIKYACVYFKCLKDA